MTTDKMREEFEAEAKAQGLSVTRTGRGLAFANGTRRDAGDYIDLLTLVSWHFWKASRAAVVVELPAEFGEDRLVSKAERHARSMTLSECICAIQAAGAVAKVAP